MEVRQIVVGVLGTAIFGGAVLGARALISSKQLPKMVPAKEVKKYVQTGKVKYSDIKTEIASFGRVVAAQPLDIIAEVPGRSLQGIAPLREGQAFAKGALIFSIDDTEAKLAIKAQKSGFMRDVAVILPDMKIDYPDSYDNWKQYFNSIDLEKLLPDLPAHKNDKEKTFLAMKNIFTGYYNIKTAESNLRKYQSYAPFDCTITEVFLQAGAYVNPGAKMIKVAGTGSMELKIPIEAKDIHWIEKGININLSDETGGEWQGRVARISEIVNQATQSIDVFVALSPGKNKVYDGMYLKATIPGTTVRNAVEVPRAAVFNGSQVFVVEQDSLLKAKDVIVHKINRETLLVSGLAEGADLVTEPLVNAHNNMRAFKLSDQKKENSPKKDNK